MDVRVLASLMAVNNRLPRRERNTLAVAALTHDTRTPAGGDTTKLIDPAVFDCAYVSRDLAVCQLRNGGESPFYPTPKWFEPFRGIK